MSFVIARNFLCSGFNFTFCLLDYALDDNHFSIEMCSGADGYDLVLLTCSFASSEMLTAGS